MRVPPIICAVALLVLAGCVAPLHTGGTDSGNPSTPDSSTGSATSSSVAAPKEMAWVEQPGFAAGAPATEAWTRLACDTSGAAKITKPWAPSDANATMRAVTAVLGLHLAGAGHPEMTGGWTWDITEGGTASRGSAAWPSALWWNMSASAWPSHDSDAAKAKLHAIALALAPPAKARLVANLTYYYSSPLLANTDLAGRLDQVVNGTPVLRVVSATSDGQSTSVAMTPPWDVGTTAPRPPANLTARAAAFVACQHKATGTAAQGAPYLSETRARPAWRIQVNSDKGPFSVEADAYTGAILSSSAVVQAVPQNVSPP